MFLATLGVMPDTYPSRLALAVFTSTPTWLTTSSTTWPRVRESSAWSRSCWYWPTPMDWGGILTSSASGSCRRRPRLMAPRTVTSRSGYSWLASSEAEYTDAPASLTMVYRSSGACSAMNSETTSSVSRLAVPLPMTMVLTPSFLTRRASSRLVPATSWRGLVG